MPQSISGPAPYASTSVAGLVSTGTQSLAGAKTFTSDLSTSGSMIANGITLAANVSSVSLAGHANIRYYGGALQSSVEGGSWRSLLTPTINVKDFGAVGDGITDDLAAFNAAIASISVGYSDTSGNTVYVPKGTYFLSKTLHISRGITLLGAGAGQGANGASTLLFNAGVQGVVVHRYNTSAAESPGDGSVIQGLHIKCSSKSGTNNHGIRLYAYAHVKDCVVTGFAGNGINIVASYGGPAGETYPTWQANHAYALNDMIFGLGGDWYVCKQAGTSAGSGGPTGQPDYHAWITDNTCKWGYILGANANGWMLTNILTQGHDGHGVFVSNGDSNAGVGTGINVSTVGGYGIYDNSFLGNTWVGCEVAATTLGAYRCPGANSRSVFTGCYGEGDGQPASYINSPSQIYGGLHGNGMTGTAIYFGANSLSNALTLDLANNLRPILNEGGGKIFSFQHGNDGTRHALKYADISTVAISGHSDVLYWDYAGTSKGYGWARSNLAILSVGDSALPRGMVGGQLFTYAKCGLINEGQRVAHSDSPSSRSGAWLIGDICFARTQTLGSNVGWVCTVSGTVGTYTEGLTATANGTTTIVLSGATDYVVGIHVGDTLLINGITGRVVDISTDLTTLTMSASVTAGAGLAIAYVAPTFQTFGTVGPGGIGITTLAAIGSSPNANGATISGVNLNLEPASASFGGVVTTGTQTFAGAKTFNAAVTFGADNTYFGVTGISAFGGGGQGSATALTGEVNFVTTVTSANDSVKLPTAALGLRCVVYNTGASDLAVFPASGAQIDLLGTNASIIIPSGGDKEFWGQSSTAWRSRSSRSGRGTITAGTNSATVTHGLVTIKSYLHATLQTADATLTRILNVVPGAGSFVVNADANATGAVTFCWTLED